MGNPSTLPSHFILVASAHANPSCRAHGFGLDALAGASHPVAGMRACRLAGMQAWWRAWKLSRAPRSQRSSLPLPSTSQH